MLIKMTLFSPWNVNIWAFLRSSNMEAVYPKITFILELHLEPYGKMSQATGKASLGVVSIVS